MKHLLNISFFTLLICLLASCEKEEETKPNNSSSSNEEKITALEGNNLDPNKILQIMNKYRSEGCTCGTTKFPAVKPVKWNKQLELASLNHSKDQEKHDELTHTGSNGSKFGERAKLANYTGFAAGENVAGRFPNEEAVMEAWKKSEGHCKNMMNKNINEVGVARSGYWTMVTGVAKSN